MVCKTIEIEESTRNDVVNGRRVPAASIRKKIVTRADVF